MCRRNLADDACDLERYCLRRDKCGFSYATIWMPTAMGGSAGGSYYSHAVRRCFSPEPWETNVLNTGKKTRVRTAVLTCAAAVKIRRES